MKGMENVWITCFASIDLKNVTIKLKDGAAAELEVKIGEGNLTYTEKVNRDYTLDRGLLDDVRDGDEAPMDVRMDFLWEYIKGSPESDSLPTIEDVLKRQGAASAWVSTDADACRPFCVDIELTNLPTPTGCGDQEVITLPDFRYEQLDHDLRAASVSCTGKCNAKVATVVRTSTST
jgi:hypothetical protein